MAKLYGFSTRKYQHHIMFAQSRLANMAYAAEDAGNQAQADYYWGKHAELCERAAIVFSNPVVVYVPYETWRYLMTVKDWAVSNGSGTGYL